MLRGFRKPQPWASLEPPCAGTSNSKHMYNLTVAGRYHKSRVSLDWHPNTCPNRRTQTHSLSVLVPHIYHCHLQLLHVPRQSCSNLLHHPSNMQSAAWPRIHYSTSLRERKMLYFYPVSLPCSCENLPEDVPTLTGASVPLFMIWHTDTPWYVTWENEFLYFYNLQVKFCVLVQKIPENSMLKDWCDSLGKRDCILN